LYKPPRLGQQRQRRHGHDGRLGFSRGVAVQVDPFESKGLKPFFHHFIGKWLKPGAFKLWVNWIQRVQGPPYLGDEVQALGLFIAPRRVAVQVACESKRLETGFSLHRLKG
jgi:hypothetical protein